MAVSPKQEFPPLLAAGFHPMTLAALRNICVDAYPASTTREKIMGGLESVVNFIAATDLAGEVWIDGSFMTQKVDPDDSDMVLRVAGADFDKATTAQVDVLNWLNEDLKKSFFCDSYFYIEYEKPHALSAIGEWDRAYWIKQFGFSRSQERKGLAVISLPLLP